MSHDTSSEPDSPSRSTLDVLVADASRVAQRIAMGLLESRGHRTAVAADGDELMAQLQSRPFDVLLIELHLPKLATDQLRDFVRQACDKGHRIRVIGLTMAGERPPAASYCDDFLTVPFQPDSLFQCVERPEPEETPPEGPPEVNQVLDWERAVEQMQGREDILLELIATFRDESETLMREIDSGLREGDTERIRRAAHTLKGAANTFCADAAAHAARTVEFLARDRQLAQIQQAYPELQEALTTLLTELDTRTGRV